jgi:hypothetical protein
VIVGGNEIPTGLRPPGWMCYDTVKRIETPKNLRVRQELCLVAREIPGERLWEFVANEDEERIVRREDGRNRLSGT